ncbi:MAG: type II toxin-antitoxin system HicB family antitoxin [Pseudolabrys sp.]
MTEANRYPAEVFFSEEDGGYIARARDLPGCSAFGETQEAAIAELQDAIGAWQKAAIAAGNPIPEPSALSVDNLPSGKILLRLPRSLHATLIERAKTESVSLNQCIIMILTAVHSASLFAAQNSSHGAPSIPVRAAGWRRYRYQDVGDTVFYCSGFNQVHSAGPVIESALIESSQLNLLTMPAGIPVVSIERKR